MDCEEVEMKIMDYLEGDLDEKTENDFEGKDVPELNIQIADSIKIHTWAKDEVLVKSSVKINNTDNDACKITYSDSGNNVEVKAGFKNDYFKGKSNSCNETDISRDVWVPDNKYFTVETINADITITGKGHSGIPTRIADRLNKGGDMIKLETISGDIFFRKTD